MNRLFIACVFQSLLFTTGVFAQAGNVGIGTNSPAALLHVQGTGTGEGNVLFKGEFKSADPGPAPAEGSGTRMIWYPDKAAFRAGRVTGNQWDAVSIGQYSMAWGLSTNASGNVSTAWGTNTTAMGFKSTAWGSTTIASGSSSTAWGENTTASGNLSTAWGELTIASGFKSTAWGDNTTASASGSTAWGSGSNASGFGSTAWGGNTTASGERSTAWGTFNTAPSIFETVLGHYSTQYTPSANGATSIDPTDRLFVVGNGTSATSRSNALVILKNGKAGFGNVSNPQYQITLGDNGVGLDRPSGSNLAFYTNSTEQVRINPLGYVGIGTSAPDNNLEIRGTGVRSARIRSTQTSEIYLDLMRSGNDWRIRNSGGLLLFGQSTDDYANVNDILRLGGGSIGPGIDNSITCGTSSTRYTTVYAVNGTINTSDARDKKDVRNLSYGLEQIMQLRPVSFEWKNAAHDGRKLGLIAQELQTVLPEVVRDWDLAYDEDGGSPPKKVPAEHLGVYYSDLIPVLIKGMQEQQGLIAEYKAEIETLKARIDALETER